MSALTQTAAGPLGVADATARNLINGAVRDPRLSSTHAFVTAVRHAYERLPTAARGPAVTAAFAWAKAYVNSPAFTNMYAAARQQARPQGLPPEELTVDGELKKQLDEKRAQITEMKQAVAAVPEKDRAGLLAAIKQSEDLLASPVTIKAMRDAIEARRADDMRVVSDLVAQWNATYPATAGEFVKRELERFMDASARVDFSIPITVFKSPAGAIVGFAAPLERPYESWVEVECMLAGREMVGTARSAVQAWLKELSA